MEEYLIQGEAFIYENQLAYAHRMVRDVAFFVLRVNLFWCDEVHIHQ